jgi:hypothetical protein
MTTSKGLITMVDENKNNFWLGILCRFNTLVLISRTENPQLEINITECIRSMNINP